jgi:hypothetical protein
MAEIDILLQTVMFTLYGNQYESREEHLLLTMFQVRLLLSPHSKAHLKGISQLERGLIWYLSGMERGCLRVVGPVRPI